MDDALLPERLQGRGLMMEEVVLESKTTSSII